MKETTPAAMPPCFERWCKRFDDIWTHQAQKWEFRNYIGGLLGESERKNRSDFGVSAQSNAEAHGEACLKWHLTLSGVTYHRLHHFLTEAPWNAQEV